MNTRPGRPAIWAGLWGFGLYLPGSGGQEFDAGDGEAALKRVGWSKGIANKRTHTVGRKAANGYGLYDMHGNVWEWCRDVLDGNAYKRRLPGWTEGCCSQRVEAALGTSQRVVRGGSWNSPETDCRAAFRFSTIPTACLNILGFRVGLFSGACEMVGGADRHRE